MSRADKPERHRSERMVAFDRAHLWHPYSAMKHTSPPYPVVSAHGVYLQLADGRQLIDGMSSWWAAIHGYNHPSLNAALCRQLESMAHVMFGGLTHPPAVDLGKRLLAALPEPLKHLFFCDSGSVAVEVAIKMALQYWFAQNQPQRRRLLAIEYGYHGDTFGAMSVSDPANGMHRMFSHLLPEQIFAQSPECVDLNHSDAYGDATGIDAAVADMRAKFRQYGDEIAAVILEPVVQGAGGMRIYRPAYLTQVRDLCDEFGALLIFDEIATGFGRTGKMFALEHAMVSPDIMCVGKALSGGYLSIAATAASAKISDTLDAGEPGMLMHGPTFMANPLACAVASANLDLLAAGHWKMQVKQIESQLRFELASCLDSPKVRAVRVQGAIGVVEMLETVDVPELCRQFVERGVWIRPFGKLIYLMPPYIIQSDELSNLTRAIAEVCR